MIRFLAVATMAVLAMTSMAITVPGPARAATCPALVAHQGYSGAANGDGLIPANSTAALKNAVVHGARIVEFDVRWSRDNVPVVIHNSTVNMTTRWSGPVADYKAATLERMHLVSPWNSDHVTPDTIPTLAAMVAEARTLDVPAVAEIKVADISAPQATSFVAAVDGYAGFSVHSFYEKSLAMVPQFPRTLLTLTRVTSVPAGYVGIDMRGSIVTASLVAQLHAESLVAGAYTTPGSGVADNAAEWAKLAADGINRIITNDTAGYVEWAKDGC
jgi:glycerophosphoryl diester phosphodiesterase